MNASKGLLHHVLSCIGVAGEGDGEAHHTWVLRSIKRDELLILLPRLTHALALRLVHTYSDEQRRYVVPENLRNLWTTEEPWLALRP